MKIDVLNINWSFEKAKISNSFATEIAVCLLDLYGNRFPGIVRGGLPHQGVDEACVILFPEATYISQNRLFALLTAKVLCMYGRCWKMSFLGQARWANVVIGYCC